MPYQVSAASTVVVWSALALVPLFVEWRARFVWGGYLIQAGIISVVAWLVALSEVAPLSRIFEELPRGDAPLLWSSTVAAFVALIVASSIAAFRLRDQRIAQFFAASALAAGAYLIRYQTDWVATVTIWSGLTVAALLLETWLGRTSRVLRVAVVTLLAMSAIIVLDEIAPVDRVIVDTESTIDHPFLWSGATIALAAMAVALFAVYRRVRDWHYGWAALALSVTSVVYLLSVGVVDAFQAWVDGSADIETLQRQSQVALSILWAILGGAAFAFGILRRVKPARVLGLALLGLATAKVFLYDLAYLDTSYRVLSFIGLGVLLLASSYLYQRVIVPVTDGPEGNGEEPDAGPPASGGSTPGHTGGVRQWLQGHHLGGHA